MRESNSNRFHLWSRQLPVDVKDPVCRVSVTLSIAEALYL